MTKLTWIELNWTLLLLLLLLRRHWAKNWLGGSALLTTNQLYSLAKFPIFYRKVGSKYLSTLYIIVFLILYFVFFKQLESPGRV